MKQTNRSKIPNSRIVCLTGILLGMLLSTGCQSKKSEKLVFVLGFHKIADRRVIGGDLAYKLSDYSGEKKTWVHAVPLFGSSNIVAAELLQTEGQRPAVKIHLDRIGQNLWLQTFSVLRGREIAVTIDGFYGFNFKVPEHCSDFSTCVIRGTWDVEEARRVAKQAAINYKIMNHKKFF